jgi:hypothetical protein
VAGLLLLVYVFQLARRPSPRQALEGAVWAFENRDMAVFERHVDIEGITGDVIDQLIDNAVRVNMADSTEFNRTLTVGLLKGIGDAIKPSLAPALRDVAEKLVTGRAWREITPQSNNSSGAGFEAAAYQAVRELLLALRHYQGVSHESTAGLSNGRVVTFFVPPRTGMKVEMELEVRFINGHWRIVRLPDVGRVLKRMSAQ